MKKGLIIIAIIMIGIMIIATKESDDFVKGCMKAGYTKEYCEAHK